MAEVVIVRDAATAGGIVADEIARLIRSNPETVLGLATGSTPLPVYDALPARLEGVDVTRVRGFALDEYVGLDPAHPESYRSVITRDVVEPLGLDPARVSVPDGSLAGIEYAGERVRRSPRSRASRLSPPRRVQTTRASSIRSTTFRGYTFANKPAWQGL